MRTALVGGFLVVVGAIAIGTGLLPRADAVRLGARTWPILLFVVAITVVTELAAEAGLFSVVAQRLASWGAGRAVVLWLLVVLLATLCTIFLSLDTTAVLLTPVVVRIARHVGLPPMPFALTTVWLANSGSLLLPISNLTNLLASSGLAGDGSPMRFAMLMFAPALVAIVIPVIVIFVVFRRQLLTRYEPAESERQPDRVLLIGSAVVVVAILPVLVSGVAVWIPAVVGALVLIGLFAARRRPALRFSLIPWQLVLLAAGLFVVIATISDHGLTSILRLTAGGGTGFPALLRLAATGALASNSVNNLPAYLALEPVAGSPLRIAALLVGVNAGPLITPWASLATLLWKRGLDSEDVGISWRRYAALGAIVVPLTVVGSIGALALVG